MCCGKNRTTVSQTRVTSPAIRPAQTRPARAARPRSNAVYFEYTGKTAMTVMGPVTGATYRFATPGSRAAVDFRDWKQVAAVPGLVRVGSL